MLVKLENISKYFGEFQALKSVDLQVSAGEIHGLVGKNGSGKSTLLKVLYGHPDISESGGYSGQVYWDGVPLTVRSPRQAADLGIAMVHQEFALLGGFSIAQNLSLGCESTYPFTRWLGSSLACIDSSAGRRLARETLAGLGLAQLDVNLDTDLLTVNLKHFMEIARETSRRKLRLLILDEPTAALNRQEAAILTTILRRLAERGTAILYVSHQLEDILGACDSISILRDGEVTARLNKGEPGFNSTHLARCMIGSSLDSLRRESRPVSTEKLLSFEHFRVDMPGEALLNLNLTLHRGEILGITGLSGHGKAAIGYGLMGLYPSGGAVKVEDRAINPGDSAALFNADIYFLPDDRKQNGLLLNYSLSANIAFPAIQLKKRFCRFNLGPLSLTDWAQADKYARKCVEEFDIHCRSIHQTVNSLSGGNQQKVCLAGAIALAPRILIAAEPTRGVDISARQSILKALREINRQHQTSLICISSEPDELRQICDRITVIHHGEAVRELSSDCSDLELTQAITGEYNAEPG
jgi:simple sugar transport system ATP-binding protein